MKTSSVKPVELHIDTSNIKGNIPYSRYEKGKEGMCWFCGNTTKKYRAFEYKKFQSKPSGWAQVKSIESTVVLKIWTCPDCEKRIDHIKEVYEKTQMRLFAILFVIGFVISTVLLKITDSTWGLSIFLGLFGGIALALLSIPVAKMITQKETTGAKEIIRKRLNEHPEVIALHNEGYDRMFD